MDQDDDFTRAFAWKAPTATSPFVGRVRGPLEVERLIQDNGAMNAVVDTIDELIRDLNSSLETIREIDDKEVATSAFRDLEAQTRKSLDVSLTNDGLSRIMLFIEGVLEFFVENLRQKDEKANNSDLIYVGMMTIIGTAAAAVYKERQSNLQSSLDEVVDEMTAITGGRF